MSITQNEFAQWKHNETTKEIFKLIEQRITDIEKTMVARDVIKAPNCQQVLSQLDGMREGLYALLNMSIDDFKTDEEEEEKQK